MDRLPRYMRRPRPVVLPREVCPSRAPSSDLGYCPCVLGSPHGDRHRCAHGESWAMNDETGRSPME